MRNSRDAVKISRRAERIAARILKHAELRMTVRETPDDRAAKQVLNSRGVTYMPHKVQGERRDVIS